MLVRTLEPEVMNSAQDALDYDAMDHSVVNRVFVDDLLAAGQLGRDVLDLGTGTALIPIELCQRQLDVRVMASDASYHMLDSARYNLEMSRMTERIQLHKGDAKRTGFPDAYFDTVISNSIIHHIPEPIEVFAEAFRVLRPNGMIFFRDLVRPETCEEVERLVDLHAANENDYARQLLRQSLHAALTVEEIQAMIREIGGDPNSVSTTSDRHWTWVDRKSA